MFQQVTTARMSRGREMQILDQASKLHENPGCSSQESVLRFAQEAEDEEQRCCVTAPAVCQASVQTGRSSREQS